MPLGHTTYLQLIDLAQSDAAIAQLLSGAPVPASTPSEAYGWFTYSSSQQLQQALSMAFSNIHRQQLGELQQQLEQWQQEQQQQQQAAAGELQLQAWGVLVCVHYTASGISHGLPLAIVYACVCMLAL
jgi:exonuclease VII large subunit